MNRLRLLIPCLCAALFLLAGRSRAGTVVWSENFDTNAASRWIIPKGWHISAPTAGPKTNAAGHRAFSGANCANTQNYAVNTNVRLICTNYNGSSTLDIPSADQFPRLRFWHWFNLQSALSYVEISTDGGSNWIQLSPTYKNITGGGVWSRPYIDLTDYAGQSVMFALHFFGAFTSNQLGWYVDDMEVVTSTEPPTLHFPESFESDPRMSDWSVDFGTWQIGVPTTGPTNNALGFRAHSGTNCAATVLDGTYANYVDSRLTSPPFTVPATAPTLHFWQWYSFVSALGYVEISNGTNTGSTVTNITITTNVVASLDTNVYQLFGAANTNYSTPLYWNPTIGAWTNATKMLGSVLDFNYGQYRYEAGTPATFANGGTFNDYITPTVFPSPPSTTPTNFLSLQGTNWFSTIVGGNDVGIGYFGTNYTYTYSTNTTVVTTGGTWNQIGPTWEPGSAKTWTEQSLDLSAYAGQTVQIAFHFTSGQGTALGWYLDDISMTAAPTLIVPTNQFVNFGQQFTNILTATNPVEPASVFTFALAEPSPDVIIKTNGVVIWTNTTVAPGTYEILAKVTDHNTPPLSDTNMFSVTVLPLQSQLVLTNIALVTITNGVQGFKFSVKTPWTNNPLVIMATTNLTSATNWMPIYTNPGAGTLQFTDQLSTNFILRYYRVMFQ
jgi:hypothetical protein